MQVNLTTNSVLLSIASVLAIYHFIYILFNPQYRKKKNSQIYLLLAAAIVWIAGATMQVLLMSQPVDFFWQKVEVSGSHLLAFSWFIFLLNYTGNTRWITLRNQMMSAIPALVMILLTWTNSWHQLYWAPAPYTGDHLFPPSYLPGPLYMVGMVTTGVYLLIELGLLVRSARQFGGQNRAQLILLLLCTIIPWGTIYYFQLETLRTGQQSPFPYLFSLNFILIVFALVRLRLLRTVPIALDAVVDALDSGLLVLSLQNRVLSYNPYFAQVLHLPEFENIEQPVQQLLADHPLLVEKICQNDRTLAETILLQSQGKAGHFALRLSFLSDRWKNQVGKMVLLEDISHRVESERLSRESGEMLRQSEETYRQLVENIHEVLFILNPSGAFTYLSPAIERYTGYRPQELYGQHYHIMFGPHQFENLDAMFQRTLDGEKVSYELTITDKIDNQRIVLIRQQALLANDRVTGVHGMMTDITERLQVEEALERRASQLVILNNIGEKIATLSDLNTVLDGATNIIQSNFGYYHVALFLPEPGKNELVMRSASGAFSSIFPENHRLMWGQGMVGWVAANKTMLLANDVRKEPRYANFFPDKILTHSELAVPILLSDELVGVLDIQSPVLNAFDDNDVRVMRTIADQMAIAIENARLYDAVRNQLKETEYKENMLRIQRDLVVAISATTHPQEMLNAAVETLSIELDVPRVMVVMVDAECRCLHPVASIGSSETKRHLSLPLDNGVVGWVARTGQPALFGDVSQVPYSMDLSPDTRSALCVPLLSGGIVMGAILLESQTTNAFTNDNLRLLTILSSNLTALIERARLFQEVEAARAELEERAAALEAANVRLRELDRLKSQFLANMSHELRTPLNSIIGFSEILIDHLAGPINPEQAEYIDNIYESGKHLLALINDLLDFSKIEAGRMVLEPTTFSITELFEEVRATFLPLAEKKGQHLIFEIQEGLPALTADRLRIKQVLINLLSNANKFTPEDGMIQVTCHEQPGHRLLLTIRDNGIGVRPEDQMVIFEEFRQVDGSMTREAAGTGLGLAISKQIVLLHHGTISVESDLGHGATFSVSLPITYQADMI